MFSWVSVRRVRSILFVTFSLMLSGCFQVQLNGPVGGATVTLALADQPDTILQTVTSKTEAELIDELGETTWAAIPDKLKRQYLGTAEFDDEQIQDFRLYLVTATGGIDYDFDHDGALDAEPRSVSGSWHAFLKGWQIKRVSTKMNLLTEATYQILGDRALFAFGGSLGPVINERPIFVPGPGIFPITRFVSFAYVPVILPSSPLVLTSLSESNAARLLEDVNGDGFINYDDVARWSRSRHADRFRRSETALDDLAARIADGEAVASAEVAASVFEAVPIPELAFADDSLLTCITREEPFYTGYRYAHEVVRLACPRQSVPAIPYIDPFGNPFLGSQEPLEIDNLAGVEALSELRWINLSQQDIEDIGPILSLRKLERLDLGGTPIPSEELAQLRELDTLRALTLANLPVTDASWLGSLQKLEELHLSGPSTNISSVLDALPQLEHLSLLVLRGGAISDEDLPRLRGLSNIRQLDLESNGIESLSGFPALAQLEALSLRDNRLTAVAEMPVMPALSRLDLGANQLESLDGIEQQTGLTMLLANGSSLSRLPDLSKLDDLYLLNLADNALTGLEGIEGLDSLQRLYLGDNEIDSLDGLRDLPSLVLLNVRGNRLSDISSVAAMTALQDLFVDDNALTDLAPLSGLTSLNTLAASNNLISSADGLGGLSDLLSLDLSANSLTDIDALLNLLRWYQLDLSDNPELPCETAAMLRSIRSSARLEVPQCGIP